MSASDELRKVQLDYIRMGTVLTAQLLHEIADAGQEVVADADANAPASKIHGSLSTKAVVRGGRVSAVMTLHGARSRGAGPAFEQIGGSPTFRHPLFGNRAYWYTQAAVPFFRPALERKSGDVERRMSDAIEKAARASGWN